MDAPAATKSTYDNISKSKILTPSRPQGYVISLKCEQPLDELTVQVWSLKDHRTLHIALCLYAGRNYGQTGRRTDEQTGG